MFKMKPAASRKYPYILFLDRSKEAIVKQKTVIGKIENKENHCIVAVFYLDDEWVKEANFRSMFVTYDSPKKLYIICLNQSQLKEFQSDNSVAYFSLFHELGHIHYKHLLKKMNKSQDQIRKERKNAIIMGSVENDELEADAFATEYVGEQVAVMALQRMKEDRKQRDIINNCQSGENAVLSLKEYDYRIAAIKEKKKDKNNCV